MPRLSSLTESGDLVTHPLSQHTHPSRVPQSTFHNVFATLLAKPRRSRPRLWDLLSAVKEEESLTFVKMTKHRCIGSGSDDSDSGSGGEEGGY